MDERWGSEVKMAGIREGRGAKEEGKKREDMDKNEERGEREEENNDDRERRQLELGGIEANM